MKTCCKCKTRKTVDSFYRDSGKKDGRSTECKSCTKTRVSAWNKENKKEINKRKRVRQPARHGLSKEQFNAIRARQQDACAICGVNEKLQIDHNHSCCATTYSCGKCVRGLLCRRCNLVLGLINDDASILEKMKTYIKGA